MILFNQHAVAADANACGTTSLAIVLAEIGKIPSTLAAAQALDHQMRARGLFTPPDALRAAATAHGLTARESYDCSLPDLQRATERGPVILMLSDPHYVVALSVQGEAVTIADPAIGAERVVMAAALRWGYLTWQRWMLTFDGESYGHGDRTTWGDVAANLVARLARLILH